MIRLLFALLAAAWSVLINIYILPLFIHNTAVWLLASLLVGMTLGFMAQLLARLLDGDK